MKETWWGVIVLGPEVKAALIAGIVSIVGLLFWFGHQFLKTYLDAKLSDWKTTMADKAAFFAVNTTNGATPGEPVPAEVMPQVMANARAYVNMNATPAKAATLTNFEERMLARIPIADPVRQSSYDGLA